jgi:hypothetical protein
MTRLNHPGVNGTDRNFIHALAFDRSKWKRSPIVAEFRRHHVGAQRVKALRPESVADERPRIRMPYRRDAEQVAHLTLETRDGK